MASPSNKSSQEDSPIKKQEYFNDNDAIDFFKLATHHIKQKEK